MGWLAGILSGYADRQGEIRKDNAALAEEAAKREAAVYQSLLNSDDKKLRDMAATGILQMGQGRKAASGLAGWMGKMESSPIYPIVQKYMSTPQRKETVVPGLPSTQMSGYLKAPTLDQPHGNMAQPETSPTTGGDMAQPAPLPGSLQPPPPPPPALSPDPEPPASLAASPTALAPPEPPPSIAALPGPRDPFLTPPPETTAAAAPGAAGVEAPPTAAAGAPPPPPPSTLSVRAVPGPAVGRTDVTYERPHFPTVEEGQIKASRAKEMGDYLAAVDMFKRAGDPNPERAAADFIMKSKVHAAGGLLRFKPITYQYTGPDGKVVQELGSIDESTGRMYDDQMNPLPANAVAVPKSTGAGGTNRAYTPHERLAAQMFGKPGEDAIAVDRRLQPEERKQIDAEERTRVIEDAVRKAEAVGNVDLTTAQKSSLTEELAGRWRKAQEDVRTMSNALTVMNSSLDNYRNDPIGAGQGVLVTFQKILDPTSVVRESEYARSTQGLTLKDRIVALNDRLFRTGGAGMPEAELRAMAVTAASYVKALEATPYLKQEQDRILFRAQQNRIDPRGIFGNLPETNPTNKQTPGSTGGGSQLDAPLRYDHATGGLAK